MATLPTHALVGFALVRLWPGEKKGWPMHAVAAACAMLPDADVIGMRMGIPYEDLCGHRGLTHGLAFAALTGLAAALGARKRSWFAPLALATATHGLLDALTDGGMGVAFLSPISNERFFLPWRPLHVSPITGSIATFFEQGGAQVLRSELLWVWLPVLLVLALHGFASRRARA